MRDAAARRFDILVCEALYRLSRSQADVAATFEDLRFHGVSVRPLSEGVVDEMHVGLKGTMNALQLQEIARKTRRGLQGVNRQGRHTGGRVYGYAVRREFDDAGEPVRGLRRTVPEEADVVVEIFKRYAAGASARAIAQWLNGRSLPSPRGGKWNASTIDGNAERANGVIHNELYRGVLVFGRQTWVKNRLTAKRRARTGMQEDLQRTVAPHLRIVPEDLWLRVREPYEEDRLGPLRPPPSTPLARGIC